MLPEHGLSNLYQLKTGVGIPTPVFFAGHDDIWPGILFAASHIFAYNYKVFMIL